MCFSKRQVSKHVGNTQTLWASSRLKACISSIKRSTSSSSSCTPTACSPSQRLVGMKVFLESYSRQTLFYLERTTSLDKPSHLASFFSLSFTPVCSPPHATASSFASHFSLRHLILFSCRESCAPALLQPCPPLQRRLITSLLFSPSTSKTQNKVSLKKVSCF